MLNQDKIKQCCELVPGYDYIDFPGSGYDKIEVAYSEDVVRSYELCSQEWELIHYPGFISKVIMGINALYNTDEKFFFLNVKTSQHSVSVFYNGSGYEDYPLKEDDPFSLEPFEQAIEFVLDNK